ncbi:MAG: phosphate ABC transporter permease subunit PstC [Chloroflexia bacterium]|nr:phosphate ABC transporter permease subunit PstC [Chloroflexia bacterium]
MAKQQHAESWSNGKSVLRHGDVPFRVGTVVLASCVVGLVIAMGAIMFVSSSEARNAFGWDVLFGQVWNPVVTDVAQPTFGAWPSVRGTLLSSLVAIVIAAPLALGIGIFLAELCPPQLSTPLSFLVELLAAIPSVIYGVWGVFVFVPFFNEVFSKPVSETVGDYIPWLAGPVATGRGIMVTGIVMAIMILPTIASLTRDVLRLVPNTQREAMLAVGATRWETIWLAVVPYARAGVIGAVMLGLGRALGETMAATLLIGKRISESLFAPATTAASLVANELTNSVSSLHESALITVAFALFGITLALNLGARLMIWYVDRGMAGGRS